MKRTIALFAAVLLAALPLAGCSQKAGEPEKVINLFTWDTYFPQDVLDDFTAQTGIKVNYANFSSNEEMLTKLEAAGGGEYDIVLASDYIIDIARKKGGLLEELDTARIANYGNIDPAFQGQYYDPDNLYTIPYAAGTPLIVYDREVVGFEITGYEDFWNPALRDSIVMMDDGRNVIGITLKTMGESFNTTDEAVLEAAREKLMELKPNIRALSYDNPQGVVGSGEASVGYMFTPQVLAALEAKPSLEVVYPKEGLGFGIDSIFVPKNAPHKDSAYEFINFILDGEVGARISSQVLYLCANKAAEPYLPESYKENKSLHVPSELLMDAEFIEDVGETTAVYDRIWTEFGQR